MRSLQGTPTSFFDFANSLVLLALGAWFASLAAAGETVAEKGELIYNKNCANCHGAHGEGVDGEYDEPLYGDRNLDSLAKLIERSMPEEKPELCAGDDARAVAFYIYHAFYSPQAQARLKPPRILPARLTNRQFRESVADLVASFADEAPENRGDRRRRGRGRGAESQDDLRGKEGLVGSYYESKGMNKKDKRSITRVDPLIDFDFGEGSPAENINAEQFSIAWQGSILARETGAYEFRLTTPNGARLYVNADLQPGDRNYRDDSSAPSRKPLIDAWVSSGKRREETAKLFLLGGRRYLFRLDFFKYKEKLSSIKLEWKPPHGEWQLPSNGDFSTDTRPRLMIVNTPFPPDDRSLGYERGAAISREWFNAVTQAAIEVASEIDNRVDSLTGTRSNNPDRAAVLERFANRFAARAFRRPLSKDEQNEIVRARFAASKSPEQGLKRVVLFAISSPEFLYPGLDEPRDGFSTASRLALTLWDSLPDDELLHVAASGGLDEKAGVREQIGRMLDDPRARSKMLAFFHQWLEIDGDRDLLKDKKLYPDFDKTVIADLRHSLNLLVDSIVWSDGSDYRQLLLADYLHLNDRLTLLYGNAGSSPPEAGFERVTFEPSERSGLLTHPYLLSTFAYHNNTSPIHRGVFLTRNVVGRPLKPPPVAIEFKDGQFDPTLTMREKVTRVTRDSACMSCHAIINPLGFSLEHFDAIGRRREQDNSKPIDSTSDYTTRQGETVTFTNARDVASFAANSPSSHQAFITHLFHNFVKQSPAAYGPDTLDNLRGRFADSGYHIQNLLAEIAILVALHNEKN